MMLRFQVVITPRELLMVLLLAWDAAGIVLTCLLDWAVRWQLGKPEAGGPPPSPSCAGCSGAGCSGCEMRI